MKQSFETPDPLKNAENKKKHGISLYGARKAFDDPSGFSRLDKSHSKKELRFFRYGKINRKICVVRFVIRSGKIRIFGAGFWRKAQRVYENHQKEKNSEA